MNNTLIFIAHHFFMALLLVFIFGAVIGSFLNVVIYRYPIMLEHQWNAQCHPIREKFKLGHEIFNLCFPRSHCPKCRKTIHWWMNIPIISFVLLRGKCSFCKKSIAWQYLMVELLTAFTSVIVFLHFGISLQFFELLAFTYGLIVLSFIDINLRILPDSITLSLLWLGLIVSTQNYFVPPTDAIFGAIMGYLFLWIISRLYFLLRKKEGMGLGDCKMLAMMGAWVGMMPLLNILLVAAILALIVSFIFLASKKIHKNSLIPFGPFIAIAGWYTVIYGDFIARWITLWLM